MGQQHGHRFIVLGHQYGQTLQYGHINISKHHKKIERFHSRGQHLCKFIGTKGMVCIRKSSTPKGLIWNINKATVSVFWDIKMAAVTSCENTLYCLKPLTIEKEKNFLFFENFLCTLTRENTELFIYLLFIFLMLVESRKPNAKKKENRKPQEMKPKNGIFSMQKWPQNRNLEIRSTYLLTR